MSTVLGNEPGDVSPVLDDEALDTGALPGSLPAVPAPPLEPRLVPPSERGITVDGLELIVRSVGAGAGGTGRLGLARYEAARFYATTDAERPPRQALLPAWPRPGRKSPKLQAASPRAGMCAYPPACRAWLRSEFVARRRPQPRSSAPDSESAAASPACAAAPGSEKRCCASPSLLRRV